MPCTWRSSAGRSRSALARPRRRVRRGVGHPGDGYSWSLFNPVRVSDVATVFPGNVGDLFWGGISGPRYFMDPRERLIGIVFIQAP